MVSAAVNNVVTVRITPHVIRRLDIVQKDVKVVGYHLDVIKVIQPTLSVLRHFAEYSLRCQIYNSILPGILSLGYK